MSSEALTWAFNLDATEHGLTHGQKSVLIAIANYADEAASAYPGVKRLARMTGMSERGVQYALRELEGHGLITTVEQFRSTGDRGQTTNRYYLARDPGAISSPGGTQRLRGGGANGAPQDTKKTHTPTDVGVSAGATRPEAVPSPEFLAFWDAYGYKAKRPDALRAWNRAVRKEQPARIIEVAAAFRASLERLDKLQFQPLPATWLNAEQWNDDLPETRPQQVHPTVGPQPKQPPVLGRFEYPDGAL